MMRGRQIGSWISKREARDDAPAETVITEEKSRPKLFWRWAPAVLLIAVIIAVGWWVRREGAFRRFIGSLREGKVQYVEFQPYPDSSFVRVGDERGIAALADWLRDA